jgi:hypothetical protein
MSELASETSIQHLRAVSIQHLRAVTSCHGPTESKGER